MGQVFEFISNHPFLVGAFLIFFLMFIRNESRRGGKSVTTQELVSLVNKEQAVVLDIRDRKDFESGRIAESLNIPFGSLESRMSELQGLEEKTIIVVCKMGQHSGAAGTTLRKKGFKQVFRLNGGIMGWRNENLPVVKV